jgi:hypothetical protein
MTLSGSDSSKALYSALFDTLLSFFTAATAHLRLLHELLTIAQLLAATSAVS